MSRDLGHPPRRSRRPKTTPIAAPDSVRERVIELRTQLVGDGLDAGPHTIAWHLEREGLRALSTSTIRRILHQAAHYNEQRPHRALARNTPGDAYRAPPKAAPPATDMPPATTACATTASTTMAA